jgi:hypothetical protein
LRTGRFPEMIFVGLGFHAVVFLVMNLLKSFVRQDKRNICSSGQTKHFFVGTQDLCVQSNTVPYPAFPSGWEGRFVGPGLVGLDAKILRPYKQMFFCTQQMFFMRHNGTFVRQGKRNICSSGQTEHLFVGTNESFVRQDKRIICSSGQTNHLFVRTNESFVRRDKRIICSFGADESFFVGTQDLCVQSNTVPYPAFPSGWGIVLLDPVWLDWTQRSCVPTNKCFSAPNKCFLCVITGHLFVRTNESFVRQDKRNICSSGQTNHLFVGTKRNICSSGQTNHLFVRNKRIIVL